MTLNKMLSELCDENTRSRLMRGLIQPSLHELRKELKEKLDELLEPHLSIHPITYNDYLTDTVQEIQRDRHDRAFDKLSYDSCKLTAESVRSADNLEGPALTKLLQTLKNGSRPNVEECSVSLASDVAAAYYKVSF